VFGAQLALGTVGLVAAGAAVVTAAESVHRASRGTHEVVVAGQHFTYPAVNAAAALLLALAALGLVVLVILVRGSLRQMLAYRNFVAGIGLLGPLAGHPGVTVIDDASPQAFCAGYLRPRVYISRGALDLLSPAELGAVLLHEDHHRLTFDPLRFACARVLSQALFFLPAVRPLGERYSHLAEQHADQAAVRASGGDSAPLASALLAFDAAAPPGGAGISPERVDSLLGKSSRWRFPAPLVGLSLVTLCVLVVVVWRASAVASAHATLNLPVVSSQPCMAILALMPLAACIAARACRRRLPRSARADLAVANS
jgi:Zn-dependent protease with chaperone function